jgi:hypothetical protein
MTTGFAALPPELVTALRESLPAVADEVVAAVIAGVPSYQRALSGPMGQTIAGAVHLALDGFLNLAPTEAGPAPRAVDGAFQLGRGEARSGRTTEALLAAYRIGARKSWDRLSAIAVANGMGPDAIAEFAGLTFAYIDVLSDASAAGHAEELASTGRARQRYLEQLARLFVEGAPSDSIEAAAEAAEWAMPTTLTAVITPLAQAGTVLAGLPAATLTLAEAPGAADALLLWVPDARRRMVKRAAESLGAVIGPTRAWREAGASFDRAVRAWQNGLLGDTDDHLVTLLLRSDPHALADLRARVLEPLASLRPSAAEKLTETLRSWLLNHGRREDVAAELFVHPQTVRYRMQQLRDLYGDRLEDPETVLALTVALGDD